MYRTCWETWQSVCWERASAYKTMAICYHHDNHSSWAQLSSLLGITVRDSTMITSEINSGKLKLTSVNFMSDLHCLLFLCSHHIFTASHWFFAYFVPIFIFFIHLGLPVLPNLLILLSSQFERVKEVAFALLTSLTRDKLSGVSSFKWLADSLLQYREEVTKDSVFLSQVRNLCPFYNKFLARV